MPRNKRNTPGGNGKRGRPKKNVILMDNSEAEVEILQNIHEEEAPVIQADVSGSELVKLLQSLKDQNCNIMTRLATLESSSRRSSPFQSPDRHSTVTLPVAPPQPQLLQPTPASGTQETLPAPGVSNDSLLGARLRIQGTHL